jgi:hypothetical protein
LRQLRLQGQRRHSCTRTHPTNQHCPFTPPKRSACQVPQAHEVSGPVGVGRPSSFHSARSVHEADNENHQGVSTFCLLSHPSPILRPSCNTTLTYSHPHDPAHLGKRKLTAACPRFCACRPHVARCCAATTEDCPDGSLRAEGERSRHGRAERNCLCSPSSIHAANRRVARFIGATVAASGHAEVRGTQRSCG